MQACKTIITTRRRFLRNGLSAFGIGVSGLGAGMNFSDPAQARPTAKLPRWSYGTGSHSAETVLMFRGNPSHTFYGTGPIAEKPRIKWRAKMASISSRLRGRPVVWAGTGWTGSAAKLGEYVFVGSLGGEVHAYEADTGRTAWRYRAGRMYKGSLCLFDNRLYIGNVDNRLRCLDASSGRLLWSFNTGNDLDSSPCVADGSLYIAGESGYARCLDPYSGKQKWRTYLGGTGRGTPSGSNGAETSPAVADGDYYAATYNGELHCLDARTGRKKWHARTGDDTDASPVVSGDFVYAAAEEKASNLYAFERERGREIWRYGGNKKGYWSTPAVVGNRVWIGGDDGRLHCVDAQNGKQIWTYNTGAAVWSSPCVVDGRVLFGSRSTYFYCLDAKSGRLIWRIKTDGQIISTPCIVNGTVWIGTSSGSFYCIGG